MFLRSSLLFKLFLSLIYFMTCYIICQNYNRKFTKIYINLINQFYCVSNLSRISFINLNKSLKFNELGKKLMNSHKAKMLKLIRDFKNQNTCDNTANYSEFEIHVITQ